MVFLVGMGVLCLGLLWVALADGALETAAATVVTVSGLLLLVTDARRRSSSRARGDQLVGRDALREDIQSGWKVRLGLGLWAAALCLYVVSVTSDSPILLGFVFVAVVAGAWMIGAVNRGRSIRDHLQP